MISTDTAQQLLTPADVCALLQISRPTFYRLANSGLPTVRVGFQLRVDRDELERYLREPRAEAVSQTD